LYNNENINPTLIWELIKRDIRGYAISDWGDKCIFSNKNSQSAGVMILFNSNFDYEIEHYITDNISPI
jgi:hypothetical protein